MTFNEMQQVCYSQYNKIITKEDLLENLLKTINELDSIATKIKICVGTAKAVLRRMHNCISEDKNFTANVSECKITIDVLGEVMKSHTDNEAEKFKISTLIKGLEKMIEDKSKAGNRRNWK